MNNKASQSVFLAATIMSAVILGCASSWDYAKNKDTFYSYKDYIVTNPNDIHTAEAKGLLWKKAQAEKKYELFAEYLHIVPDGVHVNDAKAEMTLLTERGWEQLLATPSVDVVAYLQFANTYHGTPQAEEAFNRVKSLLKPMKCPENSVCNSLSFKSMGPSSTLTGRTCEESGVCTRVNDHPPIAHFR